MWDSAICNLLGVGSLFFEIWNRRTPRRALFWVRLLGQGVGVARTGSDFPVDRHGGLSVAGCAKLERAFAATGEVGWNQGQGHGGILR